MSKYSGMRLSALTPYTPGEQPKDRKYIKLNTNESPFPPSKRAVKLAGASAKMLELYPDPECSELTRKIAEYNGLRADEVLVTNGSDEILNFAFMAFCDEKTPAVFPDITYGFYPVFADLNGIKYEEIPLLPDFSIKVSDYFGKKATIFIANPNAPTGIPIPLSDIEEILKNNPRNVVVIDEAYVDFGCESAISLIPKYDNLLVTQTFSKSRSMAGARLGFGAGNRELIADLNTIKYSTNPYNINRMTMAAGLGVMADDEYTKKNCKAVSETREFTKAELKGLGFEMTDSKTNFIFVKHPKISGEALYEGLKENGILVRHFKKERLSDFVRITIGKKSDMQKLIDTIKERML